ncbi:hypothetical protein ACFV98_05355 [Streptomyces violascens]|uniref:hypothetical protein n=1 Tax=Streptomyces violascens TaxID=67381 RepID=UPI00365CA070
MGGRDLSFLGESGFAPGMPTGYPQSTNDGASWSDWAETNAYWNNFTGDPTASYDPSTRAVDFAGPFSPPRLASRVRRDGNTPRTPPPATPPPTTPGSVCSCAG